MQRKLFWKKRSLTIIYWDVTFLIERDGSHRPCWTLWVSIALKYSKLDTYLYFMSSSKSVWSCNPYQKVFYKIFPKVKTLEKHAKDYMRISKNISSDFAKIARDNCSGRFSSCFLSSETNQEIAWQKLCTRYKYGFEKKNNNNNNFKPPASAACLFAKSTRRQWWNNSNGKKATRTREIISMAKLISQLPGTIAQMMGILTKKRVQVCHCLCRSILWSWTSLSSKDSNCWRDNNGKEGIWGFLWPSWSQDIGTIWQQQPFVLRMVDDALKESSNLRDKQGWSQLQIFSNIMVQPNQNIGF